MRCVRSGRHNPRACFALLKPKRSRARQFGIAVREKHNKRCGGDPAVMPVTERFCVSGVKGARPALALGRDQRQRILRQDAERGAGKKIYVLLSTSTPSTGHSRIKQYLKVGRAQPAIERIEREIAFEATTIAAGAEIAARDQADARSRRHCHAPRAAPCLRAPSSRRGRPRSIDSRTRETRDRSHRAARRALPRRGRRRRRPAGRSSPPAAPRSGHRASSRSDVVGPMNSSSSCTPIGPGMAMPMPSMRPSGRRDRMSRTSSPHSAIAASGSVGATARPRRTMTSPPRSISAASTPIGVT